MTYIKFLRGLHEELVEAVAEGENAGWHHPATEHYLRLLTWVDTVEERIRDYQNTRTKIGERARRWGRV